MNTEEKTGTATYSPEDNKLRLYVGRVPRDEYLALRADGWTSTPKQTCDFVATWTPSRRDTCLKYAEIIEDEDQGPEDRAADRAERFGEYRDKRTTEATGHADNYDQGPSAHGYQSQARAERAARRHDRQANYACDAWSKAEYWQRRTAGVIAHALYVSTPGVRMGRIKTLEAELRRYAGTGGEWEKHLTLRLAYENQMLEAQGGRAAFVEMVPGGFIGEHQIYKVNKSTATGRVVSVSVKVPRVTGWVYKTRNVAGTDYALSQIDTERLPADAYRPPTDPELAAFNAERTTEKKARPVTKSLLINPTVEDAERLQKIWNDARKARWGDENKEITKITQAQYSAHSGGTYSSCETKLIAAGGLEPRSVYGRDLEPGICKLRFFGRSIIVITDKPQKKLPEAVFISPRPAQLAIVQDRIEELQEVCRLLSGSMKNTGELLNDEQRELFRLGQLVGYTYYASLSQRGLTDKAHDFIRARKRVAEGVLL